jgi:hypothetical protein
MCLDVETDIKLWWSKLYIFYVFKKSFKFVSTHHTLHHNLLWQYYTQYYSDTDCIINYSTKYICIIIIIIIIDYLSNTLCYIVDGLCGDISVNQTNCDF